MNSLIGHKLADRYQIQEIIARGGMATVYRALDEKLDRDVAVKVIHPHLSDDEVFRDKFFREARMLAKVNHPNLVNIYDQGEDAGNSFIVLELVKGITLRQALTDFGKLDSSQILQVSKAMLAALAEAHKNEVVHRDLKPENILLADDGRIKVSDFGLARELSAHTDTGSLVGTAAYLAPEIIKRGKAEPTSDVYAFGIMLYEMLTGEQPYQGTDAMEIAYKHTSGRVPSARLRNPAASSVLDKLMLFCTEPEAQNRPKDAQAVLDWLASNPVSETDLAQTLVFPQNNNFTEVIGEYEEPEIHFEKHGSKRSVLKWLIASIVALSLGTGIGWYFGSGPGAFVAIPNVSDKTQSQATKLLSDVSENITIREVFNADYASGTVIETQPAAGILIPKNTEIVVLVSKGKEMLLVPDLAGKDLATASAEIVASRFTVGAISEWFNSDYPLGSVFSYTGKNKELAAGSAIDLQISLGEIPAVAGLQKNVAEAALGAVGLTVRKVTYRYSSDRPKNEVISVVPDDTKVGKGSTVELIVSNGPQYVKMPKVTGETILAAKSLLESLGLEVIIDTKWLTKDYGIKRVTGASEKVGATLKVGQSVTIRSR